jgi:hypothetical protein
VGTRLRQIAVLAAVLCLSAGCSSTQLGAAPKAWCDANLVQVGAAGTKSGSAFHFTSRDDVSWSQFLQSSSLEQGIIASEAVNGGLTWDKACRQAYVDAHPGESLAPLPSPSG